MLIWTRAKPALPAMRKHTHTVHTTVKTTWLIRHLTLAHNSTGYQQHRTGDSHPTRPRYPVTANPFTCSAGPEIPCSLILHSRPGAWQQEAWTLASWWPTHWPGRCLDLSTACRRIPASSTSQWKLQPRTEGVQLRHWGFVDLLSFCPQPNATSVQSRRNVAGLSDRIPGLSLLPLTIWVALAEPFKPLGALLS